MKHPTSIKKMSCLITLALLLSSCASLDKAKPAPKPDEFMAVNDGAGHQVPETSNDGKKIEVIRKTGALSLEDCLKVALEKNPAERSASASMNIAEENAGIAKSQYYPEVSASAGYSRFQKHAFLPGGLPSKAAGSLIGPENDWTASISARFTLWDSGERRAKLDSALARKEAAADEAEKVRQEIKASVYRSFYGLMAASQAKDVAIKNMERAKGHLTAAESRYSAGAVARTDVLRAKVMVEDSKFGLIKTESLISIASGDLNTAMGNPVEGKISIAPPDSDIHQPDDKELSDGFDQAKNMRPDLKAAMQKIVSARSGVEEAKSGFGPKLKAMASYGWEDDVWVPADKSWLAGLSVEMPIFTGFAKTHNLASKRAELKKDEADATRLVQSIRQEVWKSFSRLKEYYEAFRVAETMLKEAEESHRSVKERYEIGAATITDLLDAQASLTKAEAGSVTSKWDFFIAETEFKKACGSL